MKCRRVFPAMFVALLSIAFYPATALSEEVTLRAVSAFAENTEFSRNFERFIERVNAAGKGKIQINYIGGPRAIPAFEVGNAVRSGVVDIANTAGAYYTNIMPEADAVKMFSKSMAAQRANGSWAYLNELHNKKMNSWYLARQYHNVKYHIYLNKKIDGLSLNGLKIRVTPIYRDLVQSLGAVPITTPAGEVYTALERGVVDGYGWPITGIFEFGIQKVTKYRVDPGFYSLDVNVLVNLDRFNKLDTDQRKILEDAAFWLEALDSEKDADIRKEIEQQTAAGIAPIALEGADAQKFIALAEDVAWTSLIKRAPDTGAKLRELAKQ